jgi:osmotically inducible protein OsmC
MKRRSTAIWQGNGAEGKGTLTSTSGVLDKTPYSSTTRFKNEDGKAGTNPEELIAAAHSGCYAMALSYALTGAGYVPDELRVEAAVCIEKITDHFEITSRSDRKSPGHNRGEVPRAGRCGQGQLSCLTGTEGC